MIVKGNVRRLLRRATFVLAMLALAALFGCSASTVVPLRYQPSTPQGTFSCPNPITLLPLADKRADTLTIGSLGDGKRFYAETDPSEWVSWALFEELKVRGCDVKYRESAGGAAPKGYVVSGSFDTMNVESGTTLMAKANLRVRVRLEKDGQFINEQIYSGERENLGLTRVDAAQKVLSSTLQYILQDAATDVVRAAK
jgi:hypothetical protein